jgi:hypothetical protein
MTSGQIQLLTFIVTAVALLIVPLFVLLIRGLIKWTSVENKLDNMVSQLGKLTDSTDQRLRWLEENLWKRR